MTMINGFNNINNNKPITSNNDRNAEKAAPTKEFILQSLTQKAMEVMHKSIEEDVPDNAPITKNVMVKFEIPETNNICLISVENSSEDKNTQRDFIIGVRHKQRDKVISNIVLQDKTKKELFEFLEDINNQETIINTINHLSAKTDDYYNSL